MTNFYINTKGFVKVFTLIKNKAAIAASLALALLGAASLADAGTYSVVGVDWYPTTAPGTATNGYIYFGTAPTENPLDIYYGLSTSVLAPTPPGPQSSSDTASVNGMWKWKVRWTGEPGEPHPFEVSANVQFKGTASTDANAHCIVLGYSAYASASLTDAYFLFPTAGSLTSAAASSDPFDWPTDPQPYSGTYNLAHGAAAFALVAGTTNTWEGTVLMSVSPIASVSATGSYSQAPSNNPRVQGVITLEATAAASAALAAQVRLTHVGGQRVQLDIP